MLAARDTSKVAQLIGILPCEREAGSGRVLLFSLPGCADGVDERGRELLKKLLREGRRRAGSAAADDADEAVDEERP